MKSLANRLRFPDFAFPLDVRLGVRMLGRYPGLTLVATIAIAIAIALGTLYFEALNKWRNPRLPVPNADRIVSIRNWDVAAATPEGRMLQDFSVWSRQLKTIDHVGAAVNFQRNLATPDGRIEPVRGSEITANAFQLLGTPPLLGRTLTERDEQPRRAACRRHQRGALEDSLRQRSERARTRGEARHDGGNDRRCHAGPVRLSDESADLGAAPCKRIDDRASNRPFRVRLRTTRLPGTSLEDAQAELSVVGGRLSAASPQTHKNLRPRVTGYAKPLDGGQMIMIRNVLYTVNAVFMLLLAIICTNVATLVFARTATRGWEMAVRSALGASRRRIIMQLFVEALVLTAIGTVLGLVIARVALRWGLSMFAASDALPVLDRRQPVVDDHSLLRAAHPDRRSDHRDSARAARHASERAGRAPPRRRRGSVAAVRRILDDGDRRSGRDHRRVPAARRRRRLRVQSLPPACRGNRRRPIHHGDGERRRRGLRQRLAALAARTRASFEALERRLLAEPGVERVAYADRLPVADQFKYQIEIDTTTGGPKTGIRRSTLVQLSGDFFGTFGTALAAGRDFAPSDFDNGHVMIVNQAFVHYVLGDRNGIGQRVRVVSGEDARATGKEWYEIIGVVRNFGWQAAGATGAVGHVSSAVADGRPGHEPCGAGQGSRRVRAAAADDCRRVGSDDPADGGSNRCARSAAARQSRTGR
jgi:hypothetical protein